MPTALTLANIAIYTITVEVIHTDSHGLKITPKAIGFRVNDSELIELAVLQRAVDSFTRKLLNTHSDYCDELYIQKYKDGILPQ